MTSIKYNSPVILTYTFLCIGILLLSSVSQQIMFWFLLPHSASLFYPVTYFQLFSHILGHGSWNHFISNFSFILLIGPVLEEKFGSLRLFKMIAITAAITGLLNIFIFGTLGQQNTAVLGASGIVFMLIMLGSFTNVRQGDIPLTFVLIVIIFLGKEIYDSLKQDNISQFSHILGGVIGGMFGYRQNFSSGKKSRL